MSSEVTQAAEATHIDPAPSFPLQDVEGDTERAAHVSHDPALEVAHAWEHFYENARWFLLVFFPVILLTVIGFVTISAPR